MLHWDTDFILQDIFMIFHLFPAHSFELRDVPWHPFHKPM